MQLIFKCKAGTATVPDLLGYPSHGSPKCSSENTDLFEPLQENQYCLAYWCSTRDGDLIPGTLHYAKKPDCSKYKHKLPSQLYLQITTSVIYR